MAMINSQTNVGRVIVAFKRVLYGYTRVHVHVYKYTKNTSVHVLYVL